MAVDFLLCISTTAPVLTSPESLSTHLWNVAQTNFLKNCTVGHAPVHSKNKLIFPTRFVSRQIFSKNLVCLSLSLALSFSLCPSLFFSCHKHRTAPRAWPKLGPVVPMGTLGLPIETKKSCKFSSGPPAGGLGGGPPAPPWVTAAPPWGPGGGGAG